MEYIASDNQAYQIIEPFKSNNMQFGMYRIKKVGYAPNGNPVLYKFYSIASDGVERFYGNYAVNNDYNRRVKVESKPYKLVITVGIFDENGWRFDKMIFKIVTFVNDIEYNNPYELKKELYQILLDDIRYRYGAFSNEDMQTVNHAISDWVDNYLAELE